MKYLELLRSIESGKTSSDALGIEPVKPVKGVSRVLRVPQVAHSDETEAGQAPASTPSPLVSAPLVQGSELERLVTEYLEVVSGMNTLSGQELKSAYGRVYALSRRIEGLSFPREFDWITLWDRAGFLPIDGANSAPSAGETLPVKNVSAIAPVEWDDETAWLIAWFETLPIPSDSFRLDAWRVVANPEAFFAGIKAAIAQGPNGVRAKTGALRDDLEALEAILGGAL